MFPAAPGFDTVLGDIGNSVIADRADGFSKDFFPVKEDTAFDTGVETEDRLGEFILSVSLNSCDT